MSRLRCWWYRLVESLRPGRYPFRPPALDDPETFQSLREQAQEPYGFLKGHTITFWAFRDRRGVVEVMEIGHANAAICGRVTGLVHATLAALDAGDPESPRVEIRLYTVGALWFRILADDAEAQSLVDDLLRQLRDIGRSSGLVQVVVSDIGALHRYRDATARLHEDARTATSLAVRCEITRRSTPSPVQDYVPFRALRSNQPIRFDIRRSLYADDDFAALVELHQAAFRGVLLRDVESRAHTYCRWLIRDIDELAFLAKKRRVLSPTTWEAAFVPYAGSRDYYTASITSEPGEVDPGFRRLQRLYATWESTFRARPDVEPEGTSDLRRAAERWQRRAFPPGARAHGLTSHQHRFEAAAPGFVVEDLRWLTRMIETTILESDRDDDATLAVGRLLRPLLDAFPASGDDRSRRMAVSLEATDAFWEHLRDRFDRILQRIPAPPQRLSSEVPEVFDTLKSKTADVAASHRRKAFTRQTAEGVLIDGMLRGWPSVFLSTQALRARYDRWVAAVREPVWRELWCQARKQRVMMSALTEETVVFSVLADERRTRIVPFSAVDPEYHVALLHQRIGTVHYASPWSYRDVVRASEDRTSEGVERALVRLVDAVDRHDVGSATEWLRQALDRNPLAAWARFLELLWPALESPDDDHSTGARPLLEGLRRLARDDDVSAGERSLRRFVEKHPRRLADPYLYLAVSRELTRIRALGDRQEQREYLQALDATTRRDAVARSVATVAARLDAGGNALRDMIASLGDTDDRGRQRHAILRDRLDGMSARQILGEARAALDSVETQLPASTPAQKRQLHAVAADAFARALERDLAELRAEDAAIRRRIERAHAKLWQRLPRQKTYQKALEIDRQFTLDATERQSLMPRSSRFQLDYEPYIDADLADQSWALARRLMVWVAEHRETDRPHDEPIADHLAELLEDALEHGQELAESSRERMEEIRRSKLDALLRRPESVDSLIRLDLLAEAESLAHDLMRTAGRLSDSALFRRPAFGPPLRQAIALRVLGHAYRAALEMLSTRGVAVQVALAGRVEVVRDTDVSGPSIPDSIRLDDDQIVAYGPEHEVLAQLRIHRGDADGVQHVKTCVEADRFRTRLHPLSSTIAGRILNTLIPPPPRTACLLAVISRLQPEIRHLLAYWGARITPGKTGDDSDPEALGRLLTEEAIATEAQRRDARERLQALRDAPPIQAVRVDPPAVIEAMVHRGGYAVLAAPR